MKPKAILLDWDGTIVDVFHLTHQAMNETLAAYGKEPWDDQTAAVQLGRPDREKFPEIFGDQWKEALQFFYDANHRISEALSKPDLMPGAPELMEFLQTARKRGVFVGIVSNKPSALIRKEMDQLGWNGYVDSVTGSEDVVKNKPNPEALAKALESHPNRSKLLNSQILYIGDTNTDVEFARNTGMKFIGTGDKFTLPMTAAEKAPDLHTVLQRLHHTAQRGSENRTL